MADSNLGSSVIKPGESQIALFYAYPEHVNDFSIINKDTISQVQNIDTLVYLLTKKNAEEDEWPEEIHIKKLKLWWLLASSLESKISSLSDKVIIPMLEYFCRVIALSGKNMSFKKLTIEVIARLLESKTQNEQVIDMHEDWEKYEWVLEPLPEEVLWDHQTVAAILKYFQHLLSTAKKHIKACMLVKLSLHLAEKLKEYSDMEMYIRFLKCFDCLLSSKKLKEEAFVTLAVSSSFMITNILSILSKENETVNKNESRKLLYDVMNRLLNLYPLLLEKIVSYEIASIFFEHMMSSFVLMFQTSIDKVLPSFSRELSRLWQKLCECIKKVYGQTCNVKDLTVLFPLIELALQHSNRNIKKCSEKLLESTFSHLPERLFPESLKLTLAKKGHRNSHSKAETGHSTSQPVAETDDSNSHPSSVTADSTTYSNTETGDCTSHSKTVTGDSTIYSNAETGDGTSHSKTETSHIISHSVAETEDSNSHSKTLTADSTSPSKNFNQGNESGQTKSKEPTSISSLEIISQLEEISKKTCKVSLYKLPIMSPAKADEANPIVQSDFSLVITDLATEAAVEAILKKMQEEKTTKKEKRQAEANFPVYKVKVERKRKIDTSDVEAHAEKIVKQEEKYKIKTEKSQAEDKEKIKAEYLSCLNVVTKTEEILECLTANQLLELNAKLNSLVCKSLKVILAKKRDSL